MKALQTTEHSIYHKHFIPSDLKDGTEITQIKRTPIQTTSYYKYLKIAN